MGIFGAMTTAITGLQAQAYSLERISDNIANSQTTGYKRSDASFVDFVADSPAHQQALGVVNAFSRPTNTIQGDIANSDVPTYMAINGDGYFIVAKQTEIVDGQPVFGGGELYTRRGDFSFDSSGYLVNGSGYYLEGLPIDPVTGNPIGGTPEVVRITSDFLPASATTQIAYRANLPAYPLTASADPDVPGTELLNTVDFVDNDPIVAGVVSANDSQTFIEQSIAGGALTTYDASGASVPVQFRWAKTQSVATPATYAGALIGNPADLSAGIAGFNDGAAATVTGAAVAVPGDIGGPATAQFSINIGGVVQTFDVSDGGFDTLVALQGAINAAFGGAVATIVGGNQLVLTATNKTDSITITDIDAGAAALAGLTAGPTTNPTASANDLFRLTVGGIDYDFRIGTDAGEYNTLTNLVNAINTTGTLNGLITADDTGGLLTITADNTGSSFTIGGDAAVVTGLGLTAGINNPGNAGSDTWNLFYLTDSTATGTEIAWRNVGTDYVFGADSQLNPPIVAVTISNLTVNNVNLGDIVLNHGSNGITQFADEDGVAKWNDLSQNGYAAGEFVGVSVSREGRIVASYTNGRSLDLAEVVLASFNGDNGLAKVDGGAFRATPESGEPIIGSLGFVQGSALEGSNTDIADEFTKLIVTQQAYAANTRIISTSDQMIQEALNMIR